jgi:RNA polymerase sigma-70 factor (ECF subfamily)
MEMRLTHACRPEDRFGEDALARLVPRVAQGDERALEELYAATSARVFGLALRILRDRPSAEEAVVDVYAQVWRQADRHDPAKGSVASWITTLARTRSIDLARIQRRRTQRDQGVTPELAETLCDPGCGPELAAAAGDHGARVRAALERLPRDQRIAVELAFFSGLSHTEVAQTLSTPLGTIKTRIRTGLSSLRSALAAVEGDLR